MFCWCQILIYFYFLLRYIKYTSVQTFTSVQNLLISISVAASVPACVRAVFSPTGAPKAAETPAAAPADTKSRFSVSLLKYSKICKHGQKGEKTNKYISSYATVLHTTKILCLEISDGMKWSSIHPFIYSINLAMKIIWQTPLGYITKELNNETVAELVHFSNIFLRHYIHT